MCQGSRIEQIKNPRFLQPLEVPNSKFESISIYFIVSLLMPQFGYDSNFTIVDRLTKIAHFIMAFTTMTASSATILFMQNVFKIHG